MSAFADVLLSSAICGWTIALVILVVKYNHDHAGNGGLNIIKLVK